MAGLLAAKCRAELEVALSVGVVRARLSLLSLLSSLVGERGTRDKSAGNIPGTNSVLLRPSVASPRCGEQNLTVTLPLVRR